MPLLTGIILVKQSRLYKCFIHTNNYINKVIFWKCPSLKKYKRLPLPTKVVGLFSCPQGPLNSLMYNVNSLKHNKSSILITVHYFLILTIKNVILGFTHWSLELTTITLCRTQFTRFIGSQKYLSDHLTTIKACLQIFFSLCFLLLSVLLIRCFLPSFRGQGVSFPLSSPIMTSSSLLSPLLFFALFSSFLLNSPWPSLYNIALFCYPLLSLFLLSLPIFLFPLLSPIFSSSAPVISPHSFIAWRLLPWVTHLLDE